jgi:hypothetical protein
LEVTVTVFTPVVEYCVVNDAPLPVVGVPPPVHENVPLPLAAVTVASVLRYADCTDGEHVGAGVETATLLLHAIAPDESPPEVMVTLPVFVPAVAYDFETEIDVPERESVPLHTYVYVPSPPEGTAVHVTLVPVCTDVGDTEHVPVGEELNVAVTFFAAFMVSAHVLPVPVQFPLHPANTEPADAAAVSVTDVPLL